jgi:dihydropyrimidinase
MKKLIKNGILVTASETFAADIYIEGEKILQIGEKLTGFEDVEEFDATGMLVMPGGIDPHVHLDLPMFNTVSSDDHYTGHKAAAFGGTTTVIDFIPHENKDLKQNIDAWHQKAEGNAAIDYSFHMNISSLDDDVEAEIPHLVKEGITSIKVFTAYNDRMRLQDGEIFKILRVARDHGLLTMLHAENGDVIDILVREALAAGQTTPEWHALSRPAWGAVEAVLRGAALAAQAEAPLYIVHMNVVGEVDQLKYARDKGLAVMGETCPQYLFFNIDHLRRSDGVKWVCSPPMRTAEDNARLWEGIEDGTIEVLATDHCPFFYDGTKPIQYEGEQISIPGKELGAGDFTKIPNGLPGIGDRLPIFWTHAVGSDRITANHFVALTSTNPAKIFGLYPQKGTLMPGADADIAIWDPEREVKYGVELAHHRTDYNLYEGWDLVGYPEKVFLRGQVVVDGDKWKGHAGCGKYLHRKTFTQIR